MKNLLKVLLIFAFIGMFVMSVDAQVKEVPKATEKDNTFIVNVDFHCAGGVSRLEGGLSKIDGVAEVKADLKTKDVTIKHDSEEVSTKELVRAIEKIGHRTEYTPKDRKIESACRH